MNYIIHIAVLVCIYSILAVSLNLVVGYGGLLSLAHAAFFGIGAYALGITTTTLGWPLWGGASLGIVLAIFCSFGVALPSLRVRGDYFVIATFAFQVLIHSLFHNWVGLTRGPMGLPHIAHPTLFGWTIDSRGEFLLFTLASAVLCFCLCWRIGQSPFGRVLRTIREDEILAASYGKSVIRFKISIFALTSVLAAIAGMVYASYITFIDPTSFTIHESIFILSIVIIGGAGNLWGSILGAIFLVIMPESLRFIGLPTAAAGNLRQVLYGLALIVFVMFRPQGFIGEFTFQKDES